jgi:pimeloyl-ACP methyl ester carboxylesterase
MSTGFSGAGLPAQGGGASDERLAASATGRTVDAVRGPSGTRRVARPGERRAAVEPQPVQIGAGRLPGELARVPDALGLVVFAHGSGSSRRSPRNRWVADVLHGYGLDTLLFDLLTPAEAGQRRNTFDIPLLCERLGDAINWVRDTLGPVHVGLFGASTGAAAALCAASRHPASVAAVVSRGGRPDLAGEYLERVHAPTLLIVGGLDTDVLRLNRHAMRFLRGRTRLEVVPGANHLFEEPGALETVSHLAASWFESHLRVGGRL